MTPEEETFNKLQEPAPITDEYGTKRWFNEKGELHRENDLPAIISPDGEQHWYKDGKLHRDNGPAVIYLDGSQYWFKNGKRHRANGLPATIYNNGIEEFWENGVYIKWHQKN